MFKNVVDIGCHRAVRVVGLCAMTPPRRALDGRGVVGDVPVRTVLILVW